MELKLRCDNDLCISENETFFVFTVTSKLYLAGILPISLIGLVGNVLIVIIWSRMKYHPLRLILVILASCHNLFMCLYHAHVQYNTNHYLLFVLHSLGYFLVQGCLFLTIVHFLWIFHSHRSAFFTKKRIIAALIFIYFWSLLLRSMPWILFRKRMIENFNVILSVTFDIIGMLLPPFVQLGLVIKSLIKHKRVVRIYQDTPTAKLRPGSGASRRSVQLLLLYKSRKSSLRPYSPRPSPGGSLYMDMDKSLKSSFRPYSPRPSPGASLYMDMDKSRKSWISPYSPKFSLGASDDLDKHRHSASGSAFPSGPHSPKQTKLTNQRGESSSDVACKTASGPSPQSSRPVHDPSIRISISQQQLMHQVIYDEQRLMKVVLVISLVPVFVYPLGIVAVSYYRLHPQDYWFNGARIVFIQLQFAMFFNYSYQFFLCLLLLPHQFGQPFRQLWCRLTEKSPALPHSPRTDSKQDLPASCWASCQLCHYLGKCSTITAFSPTRSTPKSTEYPAQEPSIPHGISSTSVRPVESSGTFHEDSVNSNSDDDQSSSSH